MYLLTQPSSRTRAIIATAICAALFNLAGCSQNPYLAAPGGTTWQSPQTAMVDQTEARIAELNRRVQMLDDNNRQLHTQLAQSEQQTLVYRDESELLRKQLSEVAQSLESTQIAARDAESTVRGMQASTQLRGNATIQANTNLSQLASRLSLRSFAVEQDGEVIRIVMPSDQLFQPGTAQLQPQAAGVLDPVSTQLRSIFPRQRIAIEGYTDNAQLYGGSVATSHQLASAQAAAVLDMLTRRSGMSPQQLFTVAQGANHPRQSNDTAAGRAANRRIELVVYPQTF
jgi:flagellar motor protein MotB